MCGGSIINGQQESIIVRVRLIQRSQRRAPVVEIVLARPPNFHVILVQFRSGRYVETFRPIVPMRPTIGAAHCGLVGREEGAE